MRRKSIFNTVKNLNGELNEQTSSSSTTTNKKSFESAFSAYLLGFYQLELHASACPGNEVGIGWVIKKGNQELPQLKRTSPLIRGALTIHGGFLFDFACLGQRYIYNALVLSSSGDLGRKDWQRCFEHLQSYSLATHWMGLLTFQPLRNNTSVIEVQPGIFFIWKTWRRIEKEWLCCLTNSLFY